MQIPFRRFMNQMLRVARCYCLLALFCAAQVNAANAQFNAANAQFNAANAQVNAMLLTHRSMLLTHRNVGS